MTRKQKPSKEHIHEEQIVNAILASHHVRPSDGTTPVKVAHGFGVVMGKHACAVGAGVLYAGIDRAALLANPLHAFAMAYDVSHAFACGVSDGFESDPTGRIVCVHMDSLATEDATGLHATAAVLADYDRGWNVGATVALAIGERK